MIRYPDTKHYRKLKKQLRKDLRRGNHMNDDIKEM